MVEVLTYKKDGDKISKVEVDETLFGDKVKKRLLKEAVIMYEANLRQGTHSTLTRGEVSLTGRKPYRQKGTGYARAGDFKSPLWKGGGVIFGPKPRDYSYSMPRKAKKEALRTALFAKLQDNEVYFMDDLGLEAPKTKVAATALKKLELNGSVLVILPYLKSDDKVQDFNPNLYKSFKNINKVKVLPVSEVNAYHLVRNRNIVYVGEAFDHMKERLINE